MSVQLYKAVCARLLKVDFTKRINMCCLCLGAVNNDGISVDDEILIGYGTRLPVAKPISDVLKYLLGESFSETMYVLKSVCKKCMVSALNSYNFIHACKVNTDILTEAVENLEKSLEDIPDHTYNSKTLYVAIDPSKIFDMSLVKRYYDKKLPLSNQQALSRFQTISRKSTSHGKNKNQINQSWTKTNIETVDMLLDPKNLLEFKCKVCKETFQSTTSLRVHYFKMHHVSKNVKSKQQSAQEDSDLDDPLASMEYSDSSDLENKEEKARPEDLLNVSMNEGLPTDQVYRCVDCKLTFTTIGLYTRHRNQVKKCRDRKKGKYICDYCKRCYSYKHLVRRHILFNHLGVRKFVCQECGMNCTSNSHLKCHMLKHTKQKNFVCPICGKAYQSETYLNYHITLHRTDTPYACEQCGKAFKSHLMRTEHIKRTHMPPTFECEICHRMFHESSTLRRHMPRHYNQNSKLYIHRDKVPLDKKTYPCQFCDKIFYISGERCKHVRDIHKPPSAMCDICHRRYQLPRDVRRHRKLHFDVNSKYYIHKVKSSITTTKKVKKSPILQ